MDYSKPHTLEEWINFYENKSKEEFEVPNGFIFNWLPTRGFSLMKPDPEGGMLIIYATCGDGKFWRDVGEMLALNNGLTKLCTICVRKIEPYIRFWGWKIVQQTEVDGQKRFFCKDNLGRNVVITHKCICDDTHLPCYYVTQYLIKGEYPVFSESGDEQNV